MKTPCLEMGETRKITPLNLPLEMGETRKITPLNLPLEMGETGKITPLNPPLEMGETAWKWGKPEKLVPSPLQGEG